VQLLPVVHTSDQSIVLLSGDADMPHFVIDCSESVLELTNPQTLLQAVYDTAASTGLFAESGVGGIKVRLNPYRHYLNVDGQQHFVHVFASIMEGRSVEQKRDLSERLVSTLKVLLPGVDIIAMNVRDFEQSTYCNRPMIKSRETRS
jgi:5-carboxymethyl-2-hydroxymuconate isomerase